MGTRKKNQNKTKINGIRSDKCDVAANELADDRKLEVLNQREASSEQHADQERGRRE
jgi:hypothetical protein